MPIGTTVSCLEGVLSDLTIPTQTEATVFLRVSQEAWEIPCLVIIDTVNCKESPPPKATPCSAATCAVFGTDNIGYTSVSIITIITCNTKG